MDAYLIHTASFELIRVVPSEQRKGQRAEGPAIGGVVQLKRVPPPLISSSQHRRKLHRFKRKYLCWPTAACSKGGSPN